MKFLYPASRSRCSVYLYTSFLLSCPYRAECTKLSNIYSNLVGPRATSEAKLPFAPLSHDSVNRFLLSSRFTPKQLFQEAKYLLKINCTGGIISVDDTIIDKPHTRFERNQLVERHYSGKHKRVVKGICLITLFYTDKNGRKAPINYRIYIKNYSKGKNELFREMLDEVLSWRVKPRYITSDSFYATRENLSMFRSRGYGMCVGVTKKTKVCEPSDEEFIYPFLITGQHKIEHVDISRFGRKLVVPGPGLVTIFKERMKYSGDMRYY
jgi:hypothetical protein